MTPILIIHKCDHFYEIIDELGYGWDWFLTFDETKHCAETRYPEYCFKYKVMIVVDGNSTPEYRDLETDSDWVMAALSL